MTVPLKPRLFQILLALSEGEKHGSAIMEDVLERTSGGLKLWPATLYGSLRDLEDSGWIREVEPDPEAPPEPGRRRVHALTSEGRVALRAEVERLRAILDSPRVRSLLADTSTDGSAGLEPGR